MDPKTGKDEAAHTIEYPTGNELFAWRQAAKAQKPLTWSLSSHGHATQKELHQSKPNQYYSEETQSFHHKKPKLRHYDHQPASESREIHGTSVFIPHKKEAKPPIDNEQASSKGCCPFW